MGCSPRVLALATLALAASASAFAPGYVAQELAPLRQPPRRLGTPTRQQRLTKQKRGATAVKALAVPDGYGAVMATAAFSAGMVQWAAINVAIARKKYGIKYPKMYEGTDDSVFDCVQRAHQNTLEYLPSFLSLLMLNGIAAPYSTAVVGMVWNVARIIYVVGYGKGDPNGRLPGAAVSGLAFLGLIVATFGNGVMLSGLLPGA